MPISIMTFRKVRYEAAGDYLHKLLTTAIPWDIPAIPESSYLKEKTFLLLSACI